MTVANDLTVLRPVGAALNRFEKTFAFGTALMMLRLAPGDAMIDRLVDLAEDAADVNEACRAMRDAHEHDRVTAALRCLRARRRARVDAREGCTCNAVSAHGKSVGPERHAQLCPVFVRWDGMTRGVRP